MQTSQHGLFYGYRGTRVYNDDLTLIFECPFVVIDGVVLNSPDWDHYEADGQPTIYILHGIIYTIT